MLRSGFLLKEAYNLTVRYDLVSWDEHSVMVRFGLVLREENSLTVRFILPER
jgi:hypothetical protein